jgi:hypothetical protein
MEVIPADGAVQMPVLQGVRFSGEDRDAEMRAR